MPSTPYDTIKMTRCPPPWGVLKGAWELPAVEAVFYTMEDGTEPAWEFLRSLNKDMRAKIYRLIDMLEELGPSLRRPYSAPLGDGIFELRAQFGSDISRVLYFFIVNGRAVLTHGFIKKTEKTPPAEIERAKRYRSDYLKRSGSDGDV